MACVDAICTVTDCPAGTEGCDCAALDACDAGLLCQRGACVPLNCTAGDLDCVCADGGCSGGAICVDDRCVDPGCAPGTEACACADGECAAGLLCDSGQCVPACPAGRAGCACQAGACDAGAACRDGECVALDCLPGAADCVCDADNACPAGRRCTDGLCQVIGCAPGDVGCACDAGACAAGLQCSALGVCRGCPDGAAGCACDAGDCDDGLECGANDTCVAVACDPGTEGCACAGDGECGLNSRGEPMGCDAGRCVAPSCTPGDAGCPCLDGRACTSGADVCVDGFCQPADCAPGTLDCTCSAGRCVGELTCRDGAICVEGGGFVGDVCLADGSCLPGGLCEDGICAACNAGALGCACLDGGCFGAAGCVDGVCIDQDLIEVPPADPRCYTPCNGSFEDDDGVWRRCDAEGLLEGCLDGRACVDGACLRDGEARAQCERDDQCPDYTRCIAGQCYSECRADGDCGGEQECVRKVCRTPCQSDGLDANCPAGQYCATSDGSLGHCMQMVPAVDGGAVAEAAALTVSESALRFSPSNTSRRFSITNTAPTRETLTLRKRSHVIYTADGDRETLEDADDGEDCDPARGCPLSWLSWNTLGSDAAQTQRLEVTLDAGESVTVELGAADGVEAARWQGVIEIVHPTLNRGRLALEFAKSPAGQWTGNIFYFASFGTESLDTWVALPNPAPGSAAAAWRGTKNDANVQEEIGNAFLQRWGAFRRGRIDWDELQAVLTATQTESWRWTAVQRDCPNAACYLYNSNRLGLREYSSDLDSVPVPTGIVELPFGMNIYQPDPDGAPGEMAGRIDSGTALHYAGDPAIDLAFDGDPGGCERTVGGACVTYLSALSADVAVGGRYETDAADTSCADYPDGSYTQVRTPWLLTDFMRNTAEDANSGNRYRYACRDNRLPLQLGIDPAGEALANLSLSAANPVPDGRARRRHIELIDGALINQTLLLVIFKERFESFLDPVNDSDGFEAYGFMVLTREGYGDDETDVDENGVPDLYQGSRIDDDREEPDDKLAVACDPDLVAELVGGNGALNADRAGDLVNALIEGVTAPEQATYLAANGAEQPHYLCYDTGTFDQECPAESRVLYFTVDRGTLDQAEIDALDCQADGTCFETYLDWRDRGEVLVQAEAPWRCAAPDESVCSANRFDLREGKRFFARRDDAVVGLPMRAQLDAAFRYKTRFRTRQGRNVGFAPEECLPDSNQIPYCYDPAAIEDLRARVDCLLHIQDVWHDTLSASEQATLDLFMRETFAYREEANATGERVIYDGFERSYAELLIMLGDEAYTRSFASRFDLAGQNAAAFEGSLFETGGIDLAGQVGYEMYTLHQAVQYYDEVLDRFYALSPQFWRALEAGESSANFITPETVTRYLERLVRASSQKSRAWAQIADRYRAFNRPDLARPVIERAYTGAYLESIVMSRMMLRIIDAVAPQSRPQIEAILLDTQRRYRIALNDMREAYSNISDQQTFFGIAPDYVPIPALDGEDFRQSNGFEVLLRRTQAKVQVAAEREQQAIESNRSFDSDAAQFQAELVRIRNTYEDQLASICGTFVGDDGVVYPAISLYADRSNYTAALGNPCGTVLFDVGGSGAAGRAGSLGSNAPERSGYYDVVIGNPPWTGTKRRKAEASEVLRTLKPIVRARVGEEAAESFGLPDDNKDLAFLWRALDWCRPGGLIAQVVNARLLFRRSKQGQEARDLLLQAFQWSGVLNGTAVRKTEVWPEVDSPFAIVFGFNDPPSPGDSVYFYSPVLEDQLNRRGRMRIDAEAAEPLPQELIRRRPGLLKALFRGSRLDAAVLRKLDDVGTPLEHYWKHDLSLQMGQGYQVAERSGRRDSRFLLNLAEITPNTVKGKPVLLPLDDWKPLFRRTTLCWPRDPAIYQSPLLLIRERIPADPRKLSVSVAEGVTAVAYNRSFYGLSAAGHPDAGLLVRYLALVFSAPLFRWFAMVSSSKYGIERDVILFEDLKRFPVRPLGSLDPELSRQVPALFETLNSTGFFGEEHQQWLRGIYQLEDWDWRTVLDSLAVNDPHAASARRAQRPPTANQVSKFTSSLAGILRKSVHVEAGPPDAPWQILRVGGGSQPDAGSKLEWSKILRLADHQQASRVLVNTPSGQLVAILKQYRFWTQTRARLLALEMIRRSAP